MASYERSEYVGNTDSDIHPFDLTRTRVSYGLDRTWERGQGSIELTRLRREGLSIGTRRVGFEFVGGFPRLSEDTRFGARTDLKLDLGWANMDLSGSYEELRSEESLEFAEPSLSFPSAISTEDFDARTRGHGASSDIRFRREELEGKLELDLGASWHSTDQTGTLRSFQTGFLFDPSSTFERETMGDLEIDIAEWDVDVGFTCQATKETDVYGRLTHTVKDSRGQGVGVVTLDELMGEPPTVSTFDDPNRHSSRLELLELGMSHSLCSWADLDLSVLYGSEALEIMQTVENVVIRRFDDVVDEYGVEATLAIDAGNDLHTDLTAGYGVHTTETARVGVNFTLDDEQAFHVRVATRWSPSPKAVIQASAQHDERENEAFDSRGRTERFSLSAGLQPLERLGMDVSFSSVDFDLESDTTTIIFDPLSGSQTFPTVVDFESTQRSWSTWLRWRVQENFQPRLGATAVLSTGDSEFEYSLAQLELPYGLSRNLEVGLELAVIDFDGAGILDRSSHLGRIVTLYLRRSL